MPKEPCELAMTKAQHGKAPVRMRLLRKQTISPPPKDVENEAEKDESLSSSAAPEVAEVATCEPLPATEQASDPVQVMAAPPPAATIPNKPDVVCTVSDDEVAVVREVPKVTQERLKVEQADMKRKLREAVQRKIAWKESIDASRTPSICPKGSNDFPFCWGSIL